jgi:hypothetical protein
MKLTANVLERGFRKYPVLSIAISIILFLLTWIYFRSSVIDEQQAELDKCIAEGAVFRSNVVNSAQLQQQFEFLIQANSLIAKRAFVAESMALNLQYFYKLESEIGIKYLELRPTGKTPSGKAKAATLKNAAAGEYTPLNYSVSVQGSFAQAMTFLQHIEQGAYFCRINSASFVGNGSGVTLALDLDLMGIP